MKRRSKILIWVIASIFTLTALVFLDWLGAIVIANQYLFEQTPREFSFSFKRCGGNEGPITDFVTSRNWNGRTLVIKGVASPNCAATWLFGGYKIAGDELSLTYSSVQFGAMACVCPTEVQYEIEGLPAKDYKISIEEGPLIEYRPLTYALFTTR